MVIKVGEEEVDMLHRHGVKQGSSKVLVIFALAVQTATKEIAIEFEKSSIEMQSFEHASGASNSKACYPKTCLLSKKFLD